MSAWCRGDALRSVPTLLSYRLRSLLAFHAQRGYFSSKEQGGEFAAGLAEVPETLASAILSKFNSTGWRKIDSRKLGISGRLISRETWCILQALQRNGHEAYLVGGCVRDLILKRPPKDFDVITTASLKEVMKQFHNSRVVGARFPICQVRVFGSMVEVSSFGTTSVQMQDRLDTVLSHVVDKHSEKDMLLWKNCMERDFTINSLFFNPTNYTIYDFANGLRDISRSLVCTVTPADFSFKEDCARILRAMRISARLGFQFSKETSSAIRKLSSSIANLSKARLMMELDYMLSYGAAECSIRLLKKYGCLDILLPLQAAYLADQMDSNNGNIMLLKLFRCADELVAADRPCHQSLWLALLAFHMALVNHPQDASVVLAFASVLYFGSWNKALEFVKSRTRKPFHFVPEILSSSEPKSDVLLMEETSVLVTLAKFSLQPLASEVALESVARHPWAPDIAPVALVSPRQIEKVVELFDCIGRNLKCFDGTRQADEINYKLLKMGDLGETRFTLGRIILDTMTKEWAGKQSQEIFYDSHCLASSEPHNGSVQNMVKRNLAADRIKIERIKTECKRSPSTGKGGDLPELVAEQPVVISKKDSESSKIVTETIKKGDLPEPPPDLISKRDNEGCGLKPGEELNSERPGALPKRVLLSTLFRRIKS